MVTLLAVTAARGEYDGLCWRVEGQVVAPTMGLRSTNSCCALTTDMAGGIQHAADWDEG